MVIALIQIMAFSWGMWSIADARPAWIAVKKNVAYIISPAYINNPEHQLNVRPPSIFEQNWGRPKVVMVPKDARSDFAVYETNKYLPYNASEIKENKIPITEIQKHDLPLYQIITSRHSNAIGYIPVIGEASMDLVLLIIDKKGEIVDTVLAESKPILK